MAKASKLRNFAGTFLSLRLTIIGTTCSVMPPWERSGSVNAARSWRSALVPITLVSRDTTTMSPIRSGGSS
jgi:hypothetical protein